MRSPSSPAFTSRSSRNASMAAPKPAMMLATVAKVFASRIFHDPFLSFAKTSAGLLPVAVATSRELIALMIARIGTPDRSDRTRARQPHLDMHGAADEVTSGGA